MDCNVCMFDASLFSKSQEDVETGGEFVYLPSGESDFQQIAGITPQVGSISYTSRGFGTSWNPGICMQGEHNTNSSPEASSCSSDDSEVIGIIENVGLSQEEGTDRQRSPSVENMECLTEGPASASTGMLETSTVEGLQAPDKLQDSNGNGLSGKGNPTILVRQETNMLENSLHQDPETEIAENGEVASDDLKMIGNDCLAHGQPAAKRLRLSPLLEGDGGLTGETEIAENREREVASDDLKIIGNDCLAELHGQPAAKRLRQGDGGLTGETEIAENMEREVASDDLKMIGDDCLAELHGQPAGKRLRLTPLEGDGGLTGSLSKDLL